MAKNGTEEAKNGYNVKGKWPLGVHNLNYSTGSKNRNTSLGVEILPPGIVPFKKKYLSSRNPERHKLINKLFRAVFWVVLPCRMIDRQSFYTAVQPRRQL
jgi:hypothetical protein